MVVPEDRRVRIGGDRGRPVVHALPGYPEQVGDFRGGPAAVEFQDREEPPIVAGVRGPPEAVAELPPLHRG